MSRKEYVVQKILAKRINKGREQYKIKWLNYDGEDTWQPKTNLDGCGELLQQFEREQTKTPNRAIRTEQRSPAKPVKKTIINEGPKRKQPVRAPEINDDDEIYEDNEEQNEEEEIYQVPAVKRPTAVRSNNNFEYSKPKKQARKAIEPEIMEEDDNVQENPDESDDNLNQLCTGQRGKYTIESVVRDKEGKNINYSFKVRIGNQRKVISKEALIEEDPFSLLYYYEKNIEFASAK